MGHTGTGQQQNCAVMVMYDTSAKGLIEFNVPASLETDSNTSVSTSGTDSPTTLSPFPAGGIHRILPAPQPNIFLSLCEHEKPSSYSL